VKLVFAETASAIENRTQTVTRRFEAEIKELGAGDIIEAVADDWMLHCPVKVPLLGRLEIISVAFEPLRRLADDPAYGESESRLEGIPPGIPSRARVSQFFFRHKSVSLDSMISRIEFKYV
jgi:hypothetical protein